MMLLDGCPEFANGAPWLEKFKPLDGTTVKKIRYEVNQSTQARPDEASRRPREAGGLVSRNSAQPDSYQNESLI